MDIVLPLPQLLPKQSKKCFTLQISDFIDAINFFS